MFNPAETLPFHAIKHLSYILEGKLKILVYYMNNTTTITNTANNMN